jgi:hypothetical protein
MEEDKPLYAIEEEEIPLDRSFTILEFSYGFFDQSHWNAILKIRNDSKYTLYT